MPNKVIPVSRKQAQPILDATFPEYSGRKIKIEFTDRLTFWDTNWSGGTRNQYCAVLSTDHGTRTSMAKVNAPWCNPIEGATIEMRPQCLIVCHSMFCGQDIGITIFAHPVYNMSRIIPELQSGSPELKEGVK